MHCRLVSQRAASNVLPVGHMWGNSVKAIIAFVASSILTGIAYFVAESVLNTGDSIGYGLFRLTSPLLVPLCFCVVFVAVLGIQSAFSQAKPTSETSEERSSIPPQDVEGRLRQLDQLRHESLITEVEYETKRKQILSGL